MILYADVADTLTPDVREAIETSLPCPDAVTREHLWDHNREHVMVFGSRHPYRVDEHWVCVYCGTATCTRPIPPVDRPGTLLSAGEILEMMSP